jgi:hypothetical protein
MSTAPVHPEVGTTIRISSHRKHGNGALGSGRKNTTGKKATVFKPNGDKVVITGHTAKALLRTVRKELCIPPNIPINKKGETFIPSPP